MQTINLSSNDTDCEQITINNAIKDAEDGDVVKLGPGTYIISAQINMRSGVSLVGAGVKLTTIKARRIEDFFCTNDREKYTKNLIACNGVSNCIISGITINGNAESQKQQHEVKNYYREAASGILITSSNMIKIYDVYCTWLIGDGIRNREKSSNIEIYNYECNTSNHDGIEIYSDGENWHIHNCNINLFVNSGIRIAGSPTNVRIDHCTFYSINEFGRTGNAGIELQGTEKNPIVDHCLFRNMHSHVGQAIGNHYASGTATVTNCVFYDCPGGYIVRGDCEIIQSENIVNATPQIESYWVSKGYGYKRDASNNEDLGGDGSCSEEPPLEKMEVAPV